VNCSGVGSSGGYDGDGSVVVLSVMLMRVLSFNLTLSAPVDQAG
jgi:hypothetical protein